MSAIEHGRKKECECRQDAAGFDPPPQCRAILSGSKQSSGKARKLLSAVRLPVLLATKMLWHGLDRLKTHAWRLGQHYNPHCAGRRLHNTAPHHSALPSPLRTHSSADLNRHGRHS